MLKTGQNSPTSVGEEIPRDHGNWGKAPRGGEKEFSSAARERQAATTGTKKTEWRLRRQGEKKRSGQNKRGIQGGGTPPPLFLEPSFKSKAGQGNPAGMGKDADRNRATSTSVEDKILD